MIGDRSSRENPLLKAPLQEEVRIELSAAFLRSAETGNRPWASIGIDDWLQAGKWWLLKVPDGLKTETHDGLTPITTGSVPNQPSGPRMWRQS